MRNEPINYVGTFTDADGNTRYMRFHADGRQLAWDHAECVARDTKTKAVRVRALSREEQNDGTEAGVMLAA